MCLRQFRQGPFEQCTAPQKQQQQSSCKRTFGHDDRLADGQQRQGERAPGAEQAEQRPEAPHKLQASIMGRRRWFGCCCCGLGRSRRRRCPGAAANAAAVAAAAAAQQRLGCKRIQRSRSHNLHAWTGARAQREQAEVHRGGAAGPGLSERAASDLAVQGMRSRVELLTGVSPAAPLLRGVWFREPRLRGCLPHYSQQRLQPVLRPLTHQSTVAGPHSAR